MSSVLSAPESICIIRLSAIGDCCHTLPIVRTLQAAYPKTSICWIIGKVERSLLEGADGIEFITFDKSKGVRAIADVRRKLAGRSFPIILHMHASMRANAISAVINGNRRIGFDRARARDYQWLFSNERVRARKYRHVMDGLFEFAEHLGIRERVLRWDIPVAAKDLAYARTFKPEDRPLVVISPCSSQRFRNFRNWSTENYIEITNYLQQEYRANILITGSETEIEKQYAAEISGQVPKVTNLVGQTSLKGLLAIISQADLVLCPDSGPAHMAAATGTPVIGLYATSNRLRTGPYFSQSLVADRYPEAVAAEFDSPITELRWGQRVRDPNAMNLITVADVKEKVDTVLSSNYQHPQPKLQLPEWETS